jgi:hypothetical protein
MALAVQVIPCGAQNLGGGYTPVNDGWSYRGVVAGRSYLVTLLGSVSGTTANLAATYNGDSCNLSCDAWHNPPSHTFTAPANAIRMGAAGRNNGGNLTFTDLSIQDTGSDEGIPTVQVATGLCSAGAVAIATPTAGNLLVATEYIMGQGTLATQTYASVGVPSGWTAVSAQHGFNSTILRGVEMRTLIKQASGSETDYTPAGSGYASPDYVVVREYGGGLVGANVIQSDNDTGTGTDSVNGTAPSAVMALWHLAYANNNAQLTAGSPTPHTFDYWNPANTTGFGAAGRDVSPASGAYSWSVAGADGWASEVVFLGAPVPSGPGPRSHSVMVG